MDQTLGERNRILLLELKNLKEILWCNSVEIAYFFLHLFKTYIKLYNKKKSNFNNNSKMSNRISMKIGKWVLTFQMVVWFFFPKGNESGTVEWQQSCDHVFSIASIDIVTLMLNLKIRWSHRRVNDKTFFFFTIAFWIRHRGFFHPSIHRPIGL